jgi:hypothetical protein
MFIFAKDGPVLLHILHFLDVLLGFVEDDLLLLLLLVRHL